MMKLKKKKKTGPKKLDPKTHQSMSKVPKLLIS